MELDSNKVIVSASKKEIKTFLSDSNNLIHILPQNNISDFKSTVDDCSFKVQGGFIISLVQDGDDDDNLFLKSGEKSPFPFRLTINLNESESSTEGYIHFDGEVNAFLKMMVAKPLGNLFNYMSTKLKEHFEK
jgi:hypothetical protein